MCSTQTNGFRRNTLYRFMYLVVCDVYISQVDQFDVGRWDGSTQVGWQYTGSHVSQTDRWDGSTCAHLGAPRQHVGALHRVLRPRHHRRMRPPLCVRYTAVHGSTGQ